MTTVSVRKFRYNNMSSHKHTLNVIVCGDLKLKWSNKIAYDSYHVLFLSGLG